MSLTHSDWDRAKPLLPELERRPAYYDLESCSDTKKFQVS